MSRKLWPSSALLSRWTTPPTGWRSRPATRQGRQATPRRASSRSPPRPGSPPRGRALAPGCHQARYQPLNGRLAGLGVWRARVCKSSISEAGSAQQQTGVMMRNAESYGTRYKLRGAVKAPVPSAVASAFPCCCQNHISRTHLPSSGRLLQDSSPSKWRMGTWAIGPGSVNRRLTAMRRLPCTSSCRPHQ